MKKYVSNIPNDKGRKNMKKEFIELENKARKEGLYVDEIFNEKRKYGHLINSCIVNSKNFNAEIVKN